MTIDLPVLKCGNSEPLKLGVHAGALGLAALCGLYNAAAWLSRREAHLAVNTVLYTALTIWEHQHVVHHLEALRRRAEEDAALARMKADAAQAPQATNEDEGGATTIVPLPQPSVAA
jgi:hypothetical protein